MQIPGDSDAASTRWDRHLGVTRLAAVSAVVVLVLLGCAVGTIWRYEIALEHSRVALRAQAGDHDVQVASTWFWREREAMNEYLVRPSSALVREVTSAQAAFNVTIHDVGASPGSQPELLQLSRDANAAFVETFMRYRDSGAHRQLQLVAELNSSEPSVLGPLVALQRGYEGQVQQRQAAAKSADLQALVTACVGGVVGVVATILLARYSRRLLRQVSLRREGELVSSEAQREFADALQHSQTEDEADDLLKRQLERSVIGSNAIVLRRNNSDNRLESTAPVPGSIAVRIDHAEPRSCLAVRGGTVHYEDGRPDALVHCELCGGQDDYATCQPILVAGEVIGAALVRHPELLSEAARAEVARSVSQAGPVLANLRNLALAEFRAATDALTGLPNARALQDTLKRMTAQASRQLTPLAAIMLDLDHFKQINDQYGHGRGDDVLAAVGSALMTTLRASDFAGRYGGEEFLILLPDTDRDQALFVAEKLRAAVERISVAGVDRTITASLGLALIPDDASDSAGLIRHADRLLYTAKSNGRNRIEVQIREDESGIRSDTG